jgi:hypothetical protein
VTWVTAASVAAAPFCAALVAAGKRDSFDDKGDSVSGTSKQISTASG